MVGILQALRKGGGGGLKCWRRASLIRSKDPDRPMRAETATTIAEIKQSLELLRRHL
jgi:hypothetical protein